MIVMMEMMMNMRNAQFTKIVHDIHDSDSDNDSDCIVQGFIKAKGLKPGTNITR